MKNILLKIAIFFIIILENINTYCNATDTHLASNIRDYFYNSEARNLNFTVLQNTIFTILIWLGWALAICITLITAIQFLTANSQKKAQLKEKLWLIILGVGILAGGMPLLRLVVDLITQISGSI